MKIANIREKLKRKQEEVLQDAEEMDRLQTERGYMTDFIPQVGVSVMTVLLSIILLILSAGTTTVDQNDSEYMNDGIAVTTTVAVTDNFPQRIMYSQPTTYTMLTTTTPETTVTTTTTVVTTTTTIATTTETTVPIPIVTTVTAINTEAVTDVTANLDGIDTSNWTFLGKLRTTGYVATGHKTASGEKVHVGGVAMSKSYGLPWGTKIYVEGFGIYTLNDCGCARGIVDIYCNTLKECADVTTYRNVWVVTEE
jgi:3D (Asp-Asp-Asp) domain-containing protein